ncbi:MAG TPA: galactose-1-phosphate uridylyltransferase [Actinomycetes bacterium]
MRATKTPTKLADGRELIYYDEQPGVDRSAEDQRDLGATQTSSEIRYDQLLDQWVVIASHRQERTHLPPTDQCPLCPSKPGHLTEIPASDYDVVVFENRFPSLAQDLPALEAAAGGPFVRRPGLGRCEVVCFTSDHEASFAQLSPYRVETVIEVWSDRMAELSQLGGVEQVFVFENRGEEIGVTLSHPHGQIYALPFVPPRTLRTLRSAQRHRDQTGACLFCAVLAAERAARVRVVAETERWVAFVPHAARWPFEVHVYPRRHLPDLPALDDAERTELALLYIDVLRRFDGVFGTKMPYIAAWNQAPVHADRDLAHLYLQVFSIRRAPGKLKHLAGSESGAGVWINDIAPERAAEQLRAATA